MCITNSILSCKLATSSWFFESSFFQVKMVNHYEVHVHFEDIKHQLHEKIFRHFLHYKSLGNLHEIEKYLWSFQIYLLEAFATLSNHDDYLYPNFEDMTILFFIIIFYVFVTSFSIFINRVKYSFSYTFFYPK